MPKKAQFSPAQTTKNERETKLGQLLAAANKRYGPGLVERSENANTSYLLRRPTGVISIDIATAGGWPAGAPNVLVGPDGAGKDYLLWRTAAEVQRLYGEDFCMACYFTEFKPDKMYMKQLCGFQVAFSEIELEELDITRHAMNRPGLSAGELDYYRRQIGTFIPIFGLSADHGFDEVFNFVDANICQIVAVNSIGSMQTEAKEATDSFEDFAQQRNEATLLSKAMPKFSMYLNRGSREPAEDEKKAKGGAKEKNGAKEKARVNETTLLLVNQVRSTDAAARPMKGRPIQDKDRYKTAANAWSLKHHKAIELFLHNGPRIYDEGVKPPLILGRKKQWELTKGKLGTHEGIKGEFDYFFGFGADVLGDLLNTAIGLGVVAQDGTWIKYNEDGFKLMAQGGARALEILRKTPELVDHLRTRCFQESEILCRHV